MKLTVSNYDAREMIAQAHNLANHQVFITPDEVATQAKANIHDTFNREALASIFNLGCQSTSGSTPSLISLIKAIRQLTGADLSTAKTLAESIAFRK
jgi:ribosomal protein L7/L12